MFGNDCNLHKLPLEREREICGGAQCWVGRHEEKERGKIRQAGREEERNVGGKWAARNRGGTRRRKFGKERQEEEVGRKSVRWGKGGS